MSLVYTVQMLSFSLASMATASIVTRDQNGQLQHFNWVGYLSVTCGLLSVWVAHQLRVDQQQTAQPVNIKALYQVDTSRDNQ